MSVIWPLGATNTRSKLINAAFVEIYEHGFEGASLNTILRKAGAAKGSLYHHFKDKRDLSLQAIEANLRGFVELYWLGPFRRHEDPVDGLEAVIEAFFALPESQRPKACPIHKLAAELDDADGAFRDLLQGFVSELRAIVSDALVRGQEQGLVQPFIDPKGVAVSLLAMASGVLTQLRLSDDPEFIEVCRRACLDYLEGLRP